MVPAVSGRRGDRARGRRRRRNTGHRRSEPSERPRGRAPSGAGDGTRVAVCDRNARRARSSPRSQSVDRRMLNRQSVQSAMRFVRPERPTLESDPSSQTGAVDPNQPRGDEEKAPEAPIRSAISGRRACIEPSGPRIDRDLGGSPVGSPDSRLGGPSQRFDRSGASRRRAGGCARARRFRPGWAGRVVQAGRGSRALIRGRSRRPARRERANTQAISAKGPLGSGTGS